MGFATHWSNAMAEKTSSNFTVEQSRWLTDWRKEKSTSCLTYAWGESTIAKPWQIIWLDRGATHAQINARRVQTWRVGDIRILLQPEAPWKLYLWSLNQQFCALNATFSEHFNRTRWGLSSTLVGFAESNAANPEHLYPEGFLLNAIRKGRFTYPCQLIRQEPSMLTAAAVKHLNISKLWELDILSLSMTGIFMEWYEQHGLHYRTRFCPRVHHDVHFFMTPGHNVSHARYYILSYLKSKSKSRKITQQICQKSYGKNTPENRIHLNVWPLVSIKLKSLISL